MLTFTLDVKHILFGLVTRLGTQGLHWLMFSPQLCISFISKYRARSQAYFLASKNYDVQLVSYYM